MMAGSCRELAVAHRAKLPAQRLLGDRDAEFLVYTRADLSQPWNRYLPSVGGQDVAPEVVTINITHVTDVTQLSDRRREILSRRHKCGHCKSFGETLEVSRGIAVARLHRDCVDPWIKEYDERNGGCDE